MPKQGILHDYDTWANKEESAQDQTCLICANNPMSFQWSDYSGEAMCTKCGAPYQLKWGTNEQTEKDEYPYLGLLTEFIEPIKEYYKETSKFTYLGTSLGARPGLDEFITWLKEHHPDLLKKQETK